MYVIIKNKDDLCGARRQGKKARSTKHMWCEMEACLAIITAVSLLRADVS